MRLRFDNELIFKQAKIESNYIRLILHTNGEMLDVLLDIMHKQGTTMIEFELEDGRILPELEYIITGIKQTFLSPFATVELIAKNVPRNTLEKYTSIVLDYVTQRTNTKRQEQQKPDIPEVFAEFIEKLDL